MPHTQATHQAGPMIQSSSHKWYVAAQIYEIAAERYRSASTRRDGVVEGVDGRLLIAANASWSTLSRPRAALLREWALRVASARSGTRVRAQPACHPGERGR